ncbi:MAG: PSD1 and planctomycete cytochrome C domain-containing protein [Isosphaeraceae bacterium]
MARPSLLLILGLVSVLLDPSLVARGAAPEPAAENEVGFNRDVRPILARHCFKCHGPDDRARKAKLRLDQPEDALKAAESGLHAIVPGRPDESELVSRILAEDDSERMPPPEAKLPLTKPDKEILRRWVSQGAKYESHWAFQRPTRPALPTVKDREWLRNPIDAYILSRLEREGLRPAPEADRTAMIRRVSLDLIGLPPTAEEVEAFVLDRSPAAYERLVDRLLASPHYGERWARRWLDLARYADTNGYEKDRPRPIWPYRDWVIRALNADLPFRQFTIDQIAGDMIPGATLEQRIATGFHRNTMLNEEGGIDPLEYRFYAMTDRVATTATAWLGLTMGCAQCHTHKFDPISQREYYRFMALLDNAEEPETDVPSPDIAHRRHEIEAKIADRIATLADQFPAGKETFGGKAGAESQRRQANREARFRDWLARESASAVSWTPLTPVKASANLPHLSIETDGSVFASGDQSKRDIYTLEFRGGLAGIRAIRIEALPDDRLPNHGPGRVYYEGPAGDFFLSEFRAMADGKPIRLTAASASGANAGSVSAAIDGDPQTGWSINGGQGQAHHAVFHLDAPVKDADKLVVELLFERYHAAGLGRFRISVTTDSRPVVARETPPEIVRLLLTAPEKRTAGQLEQLRRYHLLVAPELAKEHAAIEQLRKALPRYQTTLVMSERRADNPRPTFVHNRGEFLQPTQRVEPGVPAFLPPLAAGTGGMRFELARWLVSSDNPLTARVTMNRHWAAFFGKGLVRTVEDFGYQGEPPTHPELLDWLAVRLVQSGWSIKAMHRLIVTSATYRQASRVTPELVAKDPENRLLARGPRVRMEAEMIRDSSLRISGLLSEKIGGPSVFPPQPPGVSTEGAYGGLVWKVSPGGDRYRRGLYTFSKRTAPYAMFTTFDGPTGEVCVARREVSNSSLQALTLLNDPVFEEAAQSLGRMMAARGGSVEERAAFLFRRCLTRQPEPIELASLVRFYRGQKERLQRKELDAARIAGPGDGEPVERAAWSILARALLNTDEAVTKG